LEHLMHLVASVLMQYVVLTALFVSGQPRQLRILDVVVVLI